jgi:hypothetical protein
LIVDILIIKISYVHCSSSEYVVDPNDEDEADAEDVDQVELDDWDDDVDDEMTHHQPDDAPLVSALITSSSSCQNQMTQQQPHSAIFDSSVIDIHNQDHFSGTLHENEEEELDLSLLDDADLLDSALDELHQ